MCPGVTVVIILGSLATLSWMLGLWQWLAGLAFPLHERSHSVPNPNLGVTILKPLKGLDGETRACLESWLNQTYRGPIQILFGVASWDDPVCPAVRALLEERPGVNAQLILCAPALGANAKVSKLIQLAPSACHDYWIVSDADVRVPADFLESIVPLLLEPGHVLVNCFYKLANPCTVAMHCEAIAINSDFWTQVLQARHLHGMRFALGAVMAASRQNLERIGGFAGLVDFLADDYQLGHRIAAGGGTIVIAPTIVSCWSEPQGWRTVLAHQLRWSRTIRVCQPVPYFCSILGNGTLWPLLWAILTPRPWVLAGASFLILVRIATAAHNQLRLTQGLGHLPYLWLVPVKDLIQAALWLLAFFGDGIEWRGQYYRLRRDGKLVPVAPRRISVN